MVDDGRRIRYRRRMRITLRELEPAERILLECADHFSSVIDLVSSAAKKIRREIPDSTRVVSLKDAGTFAEIQAGISEALRYEPPVSSCSV